MNYDVCMQVFAHTYAQTGEQAYNLYKQRSYLPY